MGGAYLPWFISSISTAILADIILSVFGYDRAIPQVVSWALMQLGSPDSGFPYGSLQIVFVKTG